MAGVSKEQISAAKQMTAIEFLQSYQPQRLKRCSRGEFQLTDHSSFKINESSSVWHWKSRDIGGKSALDFLIHVEGFSFVSAVEQLCEKRPVYIPKSHVKEEKAFVLPPANGDNKRVIAYLKRRGISEKTLNLCIEKGILFESRDYHNAVFVGKDEHGVPKYAALRGIYDGNGNSFKIEQAGSNKEFSFCIPASEKAVRLSLYESAIDAMAHDTLEGESDKWRLSLGGIYAPKEGQANSAIQKPAALTSFLNRHPEITELELCLDNDFAGRWASKQLTALYENQFQVIENLPKIEGYDYAQIARIKKQKEKGRCL